MSIDSRQQRIPTTRTNAGRRHGWRQRSVSGKSHLVVSRQLLELVPLREPVVVDLAVRLEVAQQGVDFVFEAILRRLLSEIRLVDVDVAE